MLGRPPSGWTRLSDDPQGTPQWQRGGDAIHVTTRDMDQLLFIDVALAWFDRMTPEEFNGFVAR